MREALPEPLNAFGTLGKANLEAPQEPSEVMFSGVINGMDPQHNCTFL